MIGDDSANKLALSHQFSKSIPSSSKDTQILLAGKVALATPKMVLKQQIPTVYKLKT